MHRRIIAAALAAFVVAVLTVAPAGASAAYVPTLTKARAHREIVRTVQNVALSYAADTSWINDWSISVDPTYQCWRKSRTKVRCRATTKFYDSPPGDDQYDRALRCRLTLEAWRYLDGPELELVTTAYIMESRTDCVDLP